MATAALLGEQREPRVRPQPGDGPKVAMVAAPNPDGDGVANSTNVTSPLSSRSVMAGNPLFLGQPLRVIIAKLHIRQCK
jgi:hypothetical protein